MEDLLLVGIGAERRSVAGGIVIRVMDSTGGFGRAMRGSPQKGIGRGLIRMVIIYLAYRAGTVPGERHSRREGRSCSAVRSSFCVGAAGKAGLLVRRLPRRQR